MYQRILDFLFISAIVVSFSACGHNGKHGESISSDVVTNPNTANGKSDPSKLPTIKFVEEIHDFGKILEGETVSYYFKFTNTGKSDLLIADVNTSCGCTVSDYPKQPIRPGKSNFIKVSFNSAGKRGFQTKNIIVVANTQPNSTMIRIKAQVVSPAGEK
ncbi:MAG: DUF1573 domain-containing protein [Bacteroidetes bacterium]|nr:DUF1573 domain-containing protein [Bacteroidota bacterium]